MRKKLNPKDWHYWGRWNQFMLFTSPWLEFRNSEVYKKMKLGVLKGDVMVLRGHYYFLEDDCEKLYNIIVKNIKEKSDWFEKFFPVLKKKLRQMLVLEKKNDLRRFIEFMADYLGCFVWVEFVDFCLEKYLNLLCLKYKFPIVILTNKMQPKEKTPLMRYHSEFERLSKKDVDSFVKKYKWVGTHALEGSPLNRKRVFDELRTLKKSKKINQRAERRIPNELKRLIPIGRELIFHRSNQIEVIDKVAFNYRQGMKELARNYGLSYFDIISLTHYEIINLIEKGIIPKDFKKRKKKYGLTFINGKYSILLGKKLKQALRQMQPKEKIKVKEFKGTIAYSGHIVGMVKIMRSFKDVLRVKKGDIIVATETTPDYVLAMRKAGAFVTNQGGITSHAAIVAREMKKPCVIGTKIATRVLKDGQLVEVDANRGIVRILK